MPSACGTPVQPLLAVAADRTQDSMSLWYFTGVTECMCVLVYLQPNELPAPPGRRQRKATIKRKSATHWTTTNILCIIYHRNSFVCMCMFRSKYFTRSVVRQSAVRHSVCVRHGVVRLGHCGCRVSSRMDPVRGKSPFSFGFDPSFSWGKPSFLLGFPQELRGLFRCLNLSRDARGFHA